MGKGIVAACCVIGVALPAKAEAPTRESQPTGCESTYTRRQFHHAARRVMGSPIRLTRRRGRPLHRMIACARRDESRPLMRRKLARWRRWRRSYVGYWSIEKRRLPTWVRSALVPLRACESGGDYSYAGAHDGAYQYLPGTWQRAEASFPGRVIGWTARANQASPDHQDAVTGRFWPAHRGEWACGA